ncbi:hypothetical protein [Ammoniphilus resinae]|uniref:Uncharacterized protein n=1 Tax=Ammoniphilus resinae TaxID=861532 RepID=A0ABS4GY69_9BACL|nr:hypothetical protein [Ammoniphilus resinae]MBP1934825.1 hypothetical protein [Ammoniphilus resinae]
MAKGKRKGESKMATLSLRDLESSIRANSLKRKSIIHRFEQTVLESDLQKGRIRPKHPTEAKILSMFSKK